ncbi:MAG TPA: TorF family putative porin [Sphingobium sp.]|uniref:TorF family putative porin n=1 Tax=Sphingobium sp. TaxID=1912891 RepID=UPI002ECFFD41
MKKILLSAVGLVLAATPAFAQEESKPFTVSGSVGLVTDYRFRGVSQSDEHLAIQGGITVTHESGLYVGTWGSSLAGWGTFGGANMELDLVAGYKLPVTDGVTLDVGATWYMYPGGYNTTDFIEPYVKLSGTLGPVSATAGVAYAPKQKSLGAWYVSGESFSNNFVPDHETPDNPGAKGDNLYLWGDVAGGVPGTPVTLKAHLGHSNGNRGLGPFGTSVSPTGDYWDWNIGADLALGPVVLGVAYVDTNIGKAESAYLLPNFSNTTNGGSIAGSKIVGSITASF